MMFQTGSINFVIYDLGICLHALPPFSEEGIGES